ncbi:unnamed protein product [Brachionus calyciflorus]|uniref:Calcineurin-like phosphoesterase domain-containing protein n=1 Tax=Brachionus calyciflorus TaxID=104777 RepID=A0A813PT82_9BILA|nr:unnamed protein product [Brachionus calyciflorus]
MFRNIARPIELNITSEEARFFFFGDWGGIPTFPFRTTIQTKVANLMKNISKETKVHFQLALGDNFYSNGVKSVKDFRFNKTYENVYKDMSIPWFLILGNHDHIGNDRAQIQYTQFSKNWFLPDYNYKLTVKTHDGSQKLIFVILLDTMLLCENFSNKTIARKNLLYVEEVLKSKYAQEHSYLIVAGHHPVWSMGQHGSVNCLVRNLRPLLHSYRVSAYLSGHEHDLEHIQNTYLNWTVNYVVSGVSSSVYNVKANLTKIPYNSFRYFSSDVKKLGALGYAEVDSNLMNVSFIRSDGASLYNFTIPSRF